jgi:hypothetical protein
MSTLPDIPVIAKQVIESTALPTGITVSGLQILGLTLSNWVFVGTAFLLLLNLTIALPKAYRAIKGAYSCAKSKRRK